MRRSSAAALGDLRIVGWLGSRRLETRGGLTALLVGLAVTTALLVGSLEWLELQALNTQFHLRGPRPPQTPIVIVLIDEDSFDELNLPWPWPRALHGELLDVLSEGRPAAIGLDILFSEPSSRGPEDDETLARAVARAGNVVLAAALTVVNESSFTKEDLNPPLRVIRDPAVGFGVVNLPFDRDAFVRMGSLSVLHQGIELPSFDLLLHRLGVRAGIPSAPLPSTPSLLINYRGGPRTFPGVPYYRVIGREVPPEKFQGKIVLVGATSATLHDFFPTPFAVEGMAGVEIHANLLETLFQGIALRRVPRWSVVVLVLGAAAFAIWVTTRMHAPGALTLVVGAGIVHSGAAFAAFAWRDVWVDQVPVPLALLLGYGATVVENFIEVQRDKQRLGRFFSPSVLRAVVRQRGELGRSRRIVTALFSDIRGFTVIAERLSPEEVAELLEEYMTSMSEAVFKHGGTVTAFVGDEIIALYNAPFDQPDHAAQAVRTALDFQERLKTLSARWEPKCGAPLRNGVGINTGEAVVGIIGSAQRFEYGALGDAINLGSRLETLTKELATPIIIGESTCEAVRHLFACRSLGEVTVKGKEKPIKVYSVDNEGQRRAPRVVVRAPLTITEAIGELAVSMSASLSDLSRTGLGAADLPRQLATAVIVGLRFEVPGLPRPISTDGRVMWATEDRAGIEFLDLSTVDQGLLDRFLESRASQSGGEAFPG